MVAQHTQAWRVCDAGRGRALLARACLLAGLVLAGCTPLAQRTQVNVSIDADVSLRARIARVDVELRLGSALDGVEPTRIERLSATDARWPLSLQLSRGSETDDRYQLTAYARDGSGRMIGLARARSLFVEGRTLELGLHFDAECADRAEDCPAQTSCQNGECTSAFIPPESLPGAPPEPVSRTAVDGGSMTIAAKSCEGASCPAANACKLDNGGCDALRSCSSGSAGPECGPCPDGYVSEIDRSCAPALLALSAEGARLEPAFRPELTAYTLALPLRSEQLTLALSAAPGVQISVDGRPLGSAQPWTTAAPAFGDERSVLVKLERDGHPGRTLSLELRRSGELLGYLKASNAGAGDQLGSSIAASGDTLAVGAPFEDGSARSTASEPDDATKDAGAVYVFVRDASGALRQEAYLKAEAPHEGAEFGGSVALEGDRLVVGATGDGAGAAYVFERQNGAWSRVKQLRPDADAGNAQKFGYAVALSGETIAVGASGESSQVADSGAVYVFNRGAGEWAKQVKLKAKGAGPLDWFGSSLALSGDWLASSATGEFTDRVTGTGVLHVFKRSGDTWQETQRLGPRDASGCGFFGQVVALSESTLATTCWTASSERPAGAVYLYERGADGMYLPGSVLTSASAQSGDLFGRSLALSGDSLLIGAPGERSAGQGIGGRAPGTLEQSGAAYLFTHQGDAWHELVRIKAPVPAAQDGFGNSVALGGSELMFIGASQEAGGGSGVDASPAPRSAPASGALHILR